MGWVNLSLGLMSSMTYPTGISLSPKHPALARANNDKGDGSNWKRVLKASVLAVDPLYAEWHWHFNVSSPFIVTGQALYTGDLNCFWNSSAVRVLEWKLLCWVAGHICTCNVQVLHLCCCPWPLCLAPWGCCATEEKLQLLWNYPKSLDVTI